MEAQRLAGLRQNRLIVFLTSYVIFSSSVRTLLMASGRKQILGPRVQKREEGKLSKRLNRKKPRCQEETLSRKSRFEGSSLGDLWQLCPRCRMPQALHHNITSPKSCGMQFYR